MSDLALTRADIEKAQDKAYDELGDARKHNDKEVEMAMRILTEFCEVLLGRDTITSFWGALDMED